MVKEEQAQICPVKLKPDRERRWRNKSDRASHHTDRLDAQCDRLHPGCFASLGKSYNHTKKKTSEVDTKKKGACTFSPQTWSHQKYMFSETHSSTRSTPPLHLRFSDHAVPLSGASGFSAGAWTCSPHQSAGPQVS